MIPQNRTTDNKRLLKTPCACPKTTTDLFDGSTFGARRVIGVPAHLFSHSRPETISPGLLGAVCRAMNPSRPGINTPEKGIFLWQSAGLFKVCFNRDNHLTAAQSPSCPHAAAVSVF